MPFNVVSKSGKHLGFIVRANYAMGISLRGSFAVPRTLLVALTDEECSDKNVDLVKGKKVLAEYYGQTNFLGKMQEDKMDDYLEQLWRENYRDVYGADDPAFLIRLLLLKEGVDLQEYLQFDQSRVRGYVAVSKDTVIDPRTRTVVLDDDLPYLVEEALDLSNPGLHCQVVDYPEVRMSIMGLGEGLLLGANLTDFGGRNHTHQTKLRLRSGNALMELDIPMQIVVKKASSLVVYQDEKGLKAFFTDGVRYVLRS